MNRIGFLVLLGLYVLNGAGWLPAPSAARADTTPAAAPVALSDQRQEIQLILDNLATTPQIDSVRQNRQQVKNYIAGYKQKIALTQKEVDQLEQALKGIDDTQSSSQPVMNQALSELLSVKQQKEFELVELRLLLMTAEEALRQLDHYIQHQETRDIFFKGVPLWRIASSSPAEQVLHGDAAYAAIPKNHRSMQLLIVATALVFVFALVPKIQDFIRTSSSRRNMVEILMLLVTQSSAIGRFMLAAAIASALFVTLAFFMVYGQPPVVMGVLTIYFYLVLRILLQAIMYRFASGEAGSFGKHTAKGEGGALLYSFSLISAVIIVFSSDYNIYQSQTGYSGVLSSLLFFCWLFSLFMFCRYLCRSANSNFWQYVKYPLLAAVLFLSALECFGYRNAADHVVVSIGTTFITFSLALIMYDSIDLLMELFRISRDLAVNRFSMTPVEQSQRVKTHKILGFVLKVFVVICAVVLILHQWGVTDTDNDRLLELFFDGVAFGGFMISPARIVLALLVFVLSWPAIEYVKQFLDRKWLASADMSKSSRDTFLTVSGYAGYAIIILITLGVAGIRLTGLTVIIGALSVGIGFGLQNVVNNFISGLILMFERPIKKGDWIVVGSTEGYVKKISIRSTIVQTFDRADVIVPNSELIANQVTNMMFDDLRGRLRISVGVAYGSDTELVQRLLLEVAHAHKQVITDGSTPEPRAYFQTFGESSLDFDLLVHLKDIDLKIRVRSELNMAIDKAFREHGIEIPFPQRDVHLKEA